MDFVLQIFHELKLERGGCFASNLHPAAGSRCHDPDGTPGCTYAVRYAGQAWIVGFGWVSHVLNLGWSENKKPPNPMVDHHSSHCAVILEYPLFRDCDNLKKNTFSMSPMLSCCFPTCAIASYSIYSPKFHDFHSHHIVITMPGVLRWVRRWAVEPGAGGHVGMSAATIWEQWWIGDG